MKTTPCTGMIRRYSFDSAPRCGAKTRSSMPCKSPAVRGNKRCRMHGGKGSGAPIGNRNTYKHGFTTQESIADRKLVRLLLKGLKYY